MKGRLKREFGKAEEVMKFGRGLRIAAVGVLAAGLFCAGCDDDEFRDAPRTVAEPGSGGGGGLGPVSGMELPPGHPPVGGAEGGQEGGSANLGGVPAPEIPRATPEQFGKIGPIRWEAPETWEARNPSNQMRFAEYSVAGPAGMEPAEVTVFYFGPGGGGGVEDNLERWASQLIGGREAVFGEKEVNGVRVYTVDAVGDYDSGIAMGGGAPVANQRLLGAIAETEEGLFFFRLLGAEAIVDGEEEGFAAFLQSFQRG